MRRQFLSPCASDEKFYVNVIDCRKFPPVKIIALEKIPSISEKYTSFVASANTIVIIGGNIESALTSIKHYPFSNKDLKHISATWGSLKYAFKHIDNFFY